MKTYKYIDGQGNVVGPATLTSLQGLHKAGVIGDSAQIIDEERNRCTTMGQLLAEQCQGSGAIPEMGIPQASPVQPAVPLPLPPPPGAAHTTAEGRGAGIPKIGKRGWCGVVIVIIGLGTFIGAKKSAEDLIDTTWKTTGSSRVFEDEALAKAAGYSSYSDYLAGQNRQSGAVFSAIGLGLIVWGYARYNSKKPQG